MKRRANKSTKQQPKAIEPQQPVEPVTMDTSRTGPLDRDKVTGRELGQDKNCRTIRIGDIVGTENDVGIVTVICDDAIIYRRLVEGDGENSDARNDSAHAYQCTVIFSTGYSEHGEASGAAGAWFNTARRISTIREDVAHAVSVLAPDHNDVHDLEQAVEYLDKAMDNLMELARRHMGDEEWPVGPLATAVEQAA